MSIQQSLDGHSFSRPELADCTPAEEEVDVELLTPRTVLVPAPLYRDDLKEELLAANGTPLREGECAVACTPRNGCVSVAAVDSAILRQLLGKYPRARFSTPLDDVPQNTQKCIRIDRREHLVYIKVYDNGMLQLAEVIPAATEPEIRYFIERLGSLFPLSEYELRLAGNDPKQLRKWTGNEFGKTTCE